MGNNRTANKMIVQSFLITDEIFELVDDFCMREGISKASLYRRLQMYFLDDEVSFNTNKERPKN
jgi:hypothetical protein